MITEFGKFFSNKKVGINVIEMRIYKKNMRNYKKFILRNINDYC